MKIGVFKTLGLALLLAGLACLSFVSGQEPKAPASGSLKLLRARAEQGDAASQLRLGNLCESGRGVKQDYAEAVRWYRKAADQGNSTAQFNVGFAHYDGKVMMKDKVEALMWMILASKGVGGDGQRESQEVIAPFRQKVSGEMTSQQIAEAERRAREWQPKTAQESKEPTPK